MNTISHQHHREKPATATAATGRKLRKSCSLPTCTSSPGTCMHCACDGRCGRHVGGQCGDRREGSGRGCKHAGCTRDERCLHSNRATCCHCRNLVSSSGRAAKRPRVTVSQLKPRVQVPVLIPHVYHHQPTALSMTTAELLPKPMMTSDDLLEAELRAFLQDASLTGELALCEHHEWTCRRQYCNLTVLVCGTQFHLHKHPMLLESHKLHRMARQGIETGADNVHHKGGTVSVLELSAFPGGAEMFETLAIYCYTGKICFSLTNLAAMNCAIEFLEMRRDIRQSAQHFFDQHLSRGSQGLSSLLHVATAAQTLAQAQPELFHSACAALVEKCLCALVERQDMLDEDTMLQLFTLPCDLFAEFTQRVLASKSRVSGLYDQATLAQLHCEAQESLSRSHCSQQLAQRCVQLLQDTSIEASTTIEVDKMEEEPLDLSLLWTNETPDKMVIKIMDNELVISPAIGASICFSNDSFGFGVHAPRTLAETFVV